MRDGTIAANFISALFMLILLISIYSTLKSPSKKTIWYRNCVWFCFLGLLVNAISYTIDGKVDLEIVLYLVNTLSFLLIDFVIGAYSIYLYYMIKENDKNFTFKFTGAVLIICALDLIFIIIGVITGNLFAITNGLVVEKTWWDYTIFGPLACLMIFFVVLIYKYKAIGLRDFLALGSYLIITVIGAIIQGINSEIEFSYVGAALAMVIIYVIIQARSISETTLRAEIYNDLSTKDDLTGLYNRRGYENVLNEVAGCENIGAIFCDLNSLKDINDTKGHEAGDKYIQKFAYLALNSFSDAYVCRISGDEFVIILKNAENESFEGRVVEFKNELFNNDRMAALGYATGTGNEALNLITIAEKMMYVDKNDYYASTGKIKR